MSSDDLEECDDCGNLFDAFVNDRCPECGRDDGTLAFDTPDAHGAITYSDMQFTGGRDA